MNLFVPIRVSWRIRTKWSLKVNGSPSTFCGWSRGDHPNMVVSLESTGWSESDSEIYSWPQAKQWPNGQWSWMAPIRTWGALGSRVLSSKRIDRSWTGFEEVHSLVSRTTFLEAVIHCVESIFSIIKICVGWQFIAIDKCRAPTQLFVKNYNIIIRKRTVTLFYGCYYKELIHHLHFNLFWRNYHS